MSGLLLIPAIIIAVILLVVFMSGFLRYIPNNKVGIVEKLVSGRGSVKSGFIALHGEAGFQPDVLRGGWHLFIPFQYRIHSVPLVTIPRARLGISSPVMGYRSSPHSRWRPMSRPIIFRTCDYFCKTAGSRDHNAKSCVRVPTH